MSFDASRGAFFCFHFAVVTFADGLVWVGGIINFYGILIATSHGASIFSAFITLTCGSIKSASSAEHLSNAGD